MQEHKSKACDLSEIVKSNCCHTIVNTFLHVFVFAACFAGNSERYNMIRLVSFSQCAAVDGLCCFVWNGAILAVN